MKALESDLRDALTRKARQLRLVMIKLPGSGFPDWLVLAPGGAPLFIELKRPGEKPRPLQLHRINQLRRLGYDARWTDKKEQAIQWLEDVA